VQITRIFFADVGMQAETWSEQLWNVIVADECKWREKLRSRVWIAVVNGYKEWLPKKPRV